MNDRKQGKNTRPILLSYLRDRSRLLLVLLLMTAVFALVISLYELPAAAAGYAALLAGSVGLLAAVLDFISYYRRHGVLWELQYSINLSLAGLPAPLKLADEDYQMLISLLHEEKRRLTLEYDRVSDDMTDYYTLWAHQIKTPISAVDLLLQTNSGDRQALQAELFRIEQYVEMALNYIRLESRSSDYVIRHCQLDEVVRQAVRKYARLFIVKGVALEYDGVDLEVLSDEKWLGFVIEQLLSNAVKYTQKGSVAIYPEGERLVIEDSGVGIRESDLPRIFEKGYTGYNGREDKKSTGLGLYLCRRILERLSHTIEIESTPGKGTRVLLGFPRDALSPE